jgi:hypothetical protein
MVITLILLVVSLFKNFVPDIFDHTSYLGILQFWWHCVTFGRVIERKLMVVGPKVSILLTPLDMILSLRVVPQDSFSLCLSQDTKFHEASPPKFCMKRWLYCIQQNSDVMGMVCSEKFIWMSIFCIINLIILSIVVLFVPNMSTFSEFSLYASAFFSYFWFHIKHSWQRGLAVLLYILHKSNQCYWQYSILMCWL